MTLIVEDGTGKVDAESYISVEDADAYFTARGVTAWTGATAVKEAALRKATDHMRQRYRARWQGMRRSSTQALDWPRANVYVDGYLVAVDSLPDDIANACAELALRSLAGDLSPDLARGGGIQSESVGPISASYFPGADPRTVYAAVDDLLMPYLGGSGASRRVLRT